MSELIAALNQLEKEKGIDKDVIMEAIENSLLAACKRDFGSADNVVVNMDRETGDIYVYAIKEVVDEVYDPALEISLGKAKAIDQNLNLGDTVRIEITPKDFGRIAAMHARSVIVQKIKEEERRVVYDHFYCKEKDIVTGVVQRYVGEDGTVEIKNIVREAGSRTKMAVWSNDKNVDPVGACVGLNGARVNAIVNDLKGEKIDIINWNEDPCVFIENALSPSKVVSVAVDVEEKSAEVVVPDYQLSLAIGKEGQNARLAARLTGYKIDIKSESQAAEEAAKVSEEPEADEFEIEEDLFNEEINDDFVEDAENTEEAVEDFDAEDIEE